MFRIAAEGLQPANGESTATYDLKTSDALRRGCLQSHLKTASLGRATDLAERFGDAGVILTFWRLRELENGSPGLRNLGEIAGSIWGRGARSMNRLHGFPGGSRPGARLPAAASAHPSSSKKAPQKHSEVLKSSHVDSPSSPMHSSHSWRSPPLTLE